MKVIEAGLSGAYLVEGERIDDERGHFMRTFDAVEFETAGMATSFAQSSLSFNRTVATLRGLHFQQAPYGEAKLVRCGRGAVWDVAVDLRPDSIDFGRWVGHELSESNGRAVYLPDGVAHGFITLEPDTELRYDITASYRPEAARGVRWDDPDLAIDWPLEPSIISERDASLPPLGELHVR